MKRLCFLSPDVSHAKKVVQDLKGDGIADEHLYIVAKIGAELDDLPDSGAEDDDFLPAFERGVTIGGAAGLFVGLLAISLPSIGLVVGGGAVVLAGLMGASVGGLLTGMAGAAFPNSRLQAFESDINAGKILIMVDVPIKDITRINKLIHRLDPDIEIEGIEPPAPIIP